MRILHYFLGFPPYRTGGLTKYAFDLMRAQVKDGNTVLALWPGQMGLINHKTSIKKKLNVNGIQNYELINPLPVSLDEGITEFDDYMKSCDPIVYELFFRNVKPDVIHIHTLMGLHKEFVDMALKLHIKTVFTTHDYFGICPKVTLYKFGKVCQNDHDCRDCIQCNYMALPTRKIMLMQSSIYRMLKNSIFVKYFRKYHRAKFFSNEEIPNTMISDIDILKLEKRYQNLRTYYVGMLENIDCIHFNSTLTASIYKKYLTPKNSVIMTITHQNIKDNRMINKWKPKEKLVITSLTPAKPFKGFNILKTALDELWEDDERQFELKLFSPVQNPSPYMKIQEAGFSYDKLPNILNDTDVLVACSVWYETFGFTVLEALSYGVPVIVSDHVGAKDIVGNGGIVIEAGNVEELKDAIRSLTSEKQKQLRENIKKENMIKTWKNFLDENYQLYGESK